MNTQIKPDPLGEFLLMVQIVTQTNYLLLPTDAQERVQAWVRAEYAEKRRNYDRRARK